MTLIESFFSPNSSLLLKFCPPFLQIAQMGSHFAQNTIPKKPLFFTQPSHALF